MTETSVTIFCNTAEDRRILLIRRSDNLYQYEVQTFFAPASEDEGFEFGWQSDGWRSGVFGSAADAELEASIVWHTISHD